MIKPLQSLRFIAIFFVFLSHLLFLQNTAYENFFNRFMYGGYWGVTFFLVLSGFVMSYNYYDKFEKPERNQIFKFIKKRLSKLYPIHILTFIIAVPFSINLVIESPLKEIVRMILNVSLVQSFIPSTGIYFSYNSVSWYLSAGVLFYLLTPYLIKLIHKINKSNFHLLGFGVLIFLIIFISVYIGKDSINAHWLFYISPFFRVFDYILGLLIGVYVKSYKSNNRSLIYTLLEVLSLVLFAIAYYCYPYIHQTFTYGIYYLPFVVFTISVFSIQKGAVSKLLSSNLLVYLGNISFEFYMIHQLVIRYITYLFNNWNPIFISIICLLLSIISAIVINKLLKVFYKKIDNYKEKNNKKTISV